MLRTLCCLMVLNATALAAQQSPFAGTWRVTYPVGASIDNGVVTPIMGSGTLVVAPVADSLIGELNMDPDPELPARPAQRLAAPATAPAATFVARSEATLNMNGAESQATVISTWKLTVKGDSLSGTVERVLEGYEAA
ncbi:MAG TPA: hypothetical protein PKA66_13205, partial [Gemmatimonadales bacterium]|nr:hypothetical protein [Gemmatimonadales bacterium]